MLSFGLRTALIGTLALVLVALSSPVAAYDQYQLITPRAVAAHRRAELMALNAPVPAPAPPAPAAVSKPAAPPVAAPVAAPAPQRITDWLRAEDGRFAVGVGVYDDPTGQAPVPHTIAVLDLAIHDVNWYFDGHNPGVFTPLLSEGQGSVLDYWDNSGALHRLRIVSVRSWSRYAGAPPPVSGAVVAQFQTCRYLDGSVDWIFDAVAA